MRKIFIISLLAINSALSATTYYIDPSGKNTNPGSKIFPWSSLSYACSKATVPGDIIHINAGIYNETSTCLLSAGVSIEGEGISSAIHSSVGGSSYTIELESTEGTDGNQHISNILMDGNSYTAYAAILVFGRKNVEIFNCTFIEFGSYGVTFKAGSYEPPNIYATGNKFHDNVLTNCAGQTGDENGNRDALEIDGQDGMLIYNNKITDNRPDGLTGNCISGVPGYIKNVKIYNNILHKTFISGVTPWDFAIEFWDIVGGVEIYENDIIGSIDLGGYKNSRGSSTYCLWIHDNKIGKASLLDSQSSRGILIESSSSDVIVERNHIYNVAVGIYFSQYQPQRLVENIRINSNVLENIGTISGGDWSGWGVYWAEEANHDNIVNNVNICNNVLIGHTGGPKTMWGINLPHVGKATNINIRNNIIANFEYAAVTGSQNSAGNATIDYLSVENNIFFNNGRNSVYLTGLAPTHYISQNNLSSDPLFISSSDYHLKAGSPAIGKGIATEGVSTDCDGNLFKNPPSIGAYEFNVSILPAFQNAVIENSTPSLLEMNYNLNLAAVIPAATSFSVSVNNNPRNVSSVAINSNKVQLSLSSPVIYGDIITVSYSVPGINPIQTPAGDKAASLTSKPVVNNCRQQAGSNVPPAAVIAYDQTGYSGFVYDIDASGSYDPNNDNLSYQWVIPDKVSVTSASSSRIRFLSPVVSAPSAIEFQLKLFDGSQVVTRNVPVNILPYKPELQRAEITNAEASGSQKPWSLRDVSDGNLSTGWSAIGDNQWLFLKLSAPCRINHIDLAFLPGQNYSSYFDIFASTDNITWEPVLINVASCSFSGNMQVFEFPGQFKEKEYSYIRYTGHGNSSDALNNISEIRIFGISGNYPGSLDPEKQSIVVYPNPASDHFNLMIKESSVIKPDRICIAEGSGKIVYESNLDRESGNHQIHINLRSGIYIIQLFSDNLIAFTQKLIVTN